MARPVPAPPAVGLTVAESTPSFTPVPRPPKGAPNVVVIVLDDTGFGQLGCFGSDIETPTFDRLASDGLRYRRFHVTALCSPTRAALLTGRNHHAVGMGFLPDVPIGFPGYTARIPRSAATVARVLRDEGYSTFAVGKWHLTPRWEEHAAGPFDLWPLGLGFERFYGFLGGDTNQFAPDLVSDNGFVDAPYGPDEGYHLTEDLVDRAIRLVQDQQHVAPQKPFFLYFATGAMHAPHQAPPEWIERYRGRFDQGWERWREETFARQVELGIVPEGTTLPPRPEWVPAWEEMDEDRRRVSARMMEVFAGFLSHTDHHIGRLVSFLEEIGVLDDTVIMLLSDNGTSAEGGPVGSFNEHRFTHDMVDDPAELVELIDELGGPRAYNHYAWGWAWAGNTPFKLWKRYTWLGGVRTPLIVRYPKGGAGGGEVRDQFVHAIDLAPTLLELAGVEQPAEVDGVPQQRVDGVSIAPSFTDPTAPGRGTQYFEMLGSRSIVHDGWKATTDHVGAQLSVERELVPGSHDFAEDRWSLYRMEDDFSEAHDLADEHPEVVERLREQWWLEAGRNQVLPLDDGFITRAIALEPNPWGPKATAVFRPGGGAVNEDQLPPMGGGFRIHADVEVPDGGADGVIAALGDWSNGFALLVDEGRPQFVVNLFGDPTIVDAEVPLDPGARKVTVEYRRERSGGGQLELQIDGAPVAEATLPADLPFRWQIGGGGLLIGRDHGFPVYDGYRPPFPYGGQIRTVTLESPMMLQRRRPAEEVEAALHRE